MNNGFAMVDRPCVSVHASMDDFWEKLGDLSSDSNGHGDLANWDDAPRFEYQFSDYLTDLAEPAHVHQELQRAQQEQQLEQTIPAPQQAQPEQVQHTPIPQDVPQKQPEPIQSQSQESVSHNVGPILPESNSLRVVQALQEAAVEPDAAPAPITSGERASRVVPVASAAPAKPVVEPVSHEHLVESKDLKFVIKLGRKKEDLNSRLKKQVLLILEGLKDVGKGTGYSEIQSLIAKGADPIIAWELLEDQKMLDEYVEVFVKKFGKTKTGYKEKVFKRAAHFAINSGLLKKSKDKDAKKTFGSCGNDECLLPKYVLILTAPGNAKMFRMPRKNVAEQIPDLINKCGGIEKHSMNNKPIMEALFEAISDTGMYKKLRQVLAGMGIEDLSDTLERYKLPNKRYGYRGSIRYIRKRYELPKKRSSSPRKSS